MMGGRGGSRRSSGRTPFCGGIQTGEMTGGGLGGRERPAPFRPPLAALAVAPRPLAAAGDADRESGSVALMRERAAEAFWGLVAVAFEDEAPEASDPAMPGRVRVRSLSYCVREGKRTYRARGIDSRVFERLAQVDFVRAL